MKPPAIPSCRWIPARCIAPLAAMALVAGCQLYTPFRDANGRANEDMAGVVDTYVHSGAKPVSTLSVAQARAQPTMEAAITTVLANQHRALPPEQAAVQVRDLQVDGAAGPLAARLYSPAPAKPGAPIVLYFHGGGWVTGDLDSNDLTARAIAAEAHAKVLSVAYRLAPENRFPAAHDDAVAAYRWLLVNAAGLGADPRRIAVAGEGAGANLAINIALAARDGHFTPPVHELLIDPVAGAVRNTPSYIADEYAVPLSRADMAWYLRNAAAPADSRLELIGNADLHNLPPTTVISAEITPLESDGRFLTGKLTEQGVMVDRTEYGGTTTGFFAAGPVVGRAAEAQTFAAQGLDATFDKIGDPPPPPKPAPVRRPIRRSHTRNK